MDELALKIRNCSVCADLPMGTNPVVQLSRTSKIVIIGQAPGRAVHNTGIPWNDRSGDTLRNWLGVSKNQFYDADNFSIMGMGFCYPGKGVSGDLAPRPECAKLWHSQIFEFFENDPLILLIGQYSQRYYLKQKFIGITENVRNFEKFLPDYFVLPHPSPRNQYWAMKNIWFAEAVLPRLKCIVAEKLR